MKKILVSLAVICVISIFAVSAFAANITISGFDAEDIAAYMNYNTGLGNYGVQAPTVEAGTGDNGNGAKITAGTSAAWVQSFYVQDADTLQAVMTNWASGKFMRIYVHNTSETATIGLRLTFNATDSGMASFDCTKAVLCALDGSRPAIETSDGGGMGAGASVIIPAGFKGYAYFALDDCTIQAPAEWARPSLTNFNENIAILEIDIRVAFGNDGNAVTYILDSLEIVDEIADTADLSVIAYAAAAITGCGALVVARKKR
ncbi:MAG: hypothetical protein PUC05_08445 [Firmicutes bacterium]|nr:hypothetical protein [Bacillota bacterium]